MDFEALERLARLRDSGVLTEEEFQSQKERLFGEPDDREGQSTLLPVRGLRGSIILKLVAALTIVAGIAIFLFWRAEPEASIVASPENGSPVAAKEEAIVTTPQISNSPSTFGLSDTTIYSDGLGPIKIGMTLEEVRQASGWNVEGDGEVSCSYWGIAGGATPINMLAEDGRLARIEVGVVENDEIIRYPKFATEAGVRLGDPISKVRTAYPSLQEESGFDGAVNFYQWLVKGQRGLAFSVNSESEVNNIMTGNSSIKYYEGCS